MNDFFYFGFMNIQIYFLSLYVSVLDKFQQYAGSAHPFKGRLMSKTFGKLYSCTVSTVCILASAHPCKIVINEIKSDFQLAAINLGKE